MKETGKVMAGVLVALVVLWLTVAPDTVSRAEMQNYVKVTATEHLKLLRDDLRDMNRILLELCERQAAVEAILNRER